MVLAILLLLLLSCFLSHTIDCSVFQEFTEGELVGRSPGTMLVPRSWEVKTGILPKAVNCWAFDRPG